MRSLRSQQVVSSVACLVALLGNTGLAHPLRTFYAIDVPNASFTTAQGINPRGAIVGWFADKTDKRTHGYLLEDGVFTKLDYPNAIYTDARGINPRGDIVGAYRLAGEPSLNLHGYLLTGHGEFIALDFPGHTNTIAQRITATGLVLGCRHDTDFMTTMRGVMINSREPRETAEIGAFASMNNGSTPDGSLIVGLFTDMDSGKGRAYLLYGDTFIPFDVPGSTSTSAWDVNPAGAIAGIYRDTANKVHGFLWEGLAFTAIDYPSAAATRAFGINSRGDIVGTYVDATNAVHGFLATGDRDRDADR